MLCVFFLGHLHRLISILILFYVSSYPILTSLLVYYLLLLLLYNIIITTSIIVSMPTYIGRRRPDRNGRHISQQRGPRILLGGQDEQVLRGRTPQGSHGRRASRR